MAWEAKAVNALPLRFLLRLECDRQSVFYIQAFYSILAIDTIFLLYAFSRIDCHISMQDSRGVSRKEGKMSKDVLTFLYNRQAKIIYRYLLKHGCRKEEAEEIVQESFIKAIQYIDGGDERKLPSWIFKVALNNYRNYLKRKSVITELSIDVGGFFSRLAAEGSITNLSPKATQIPLMFQFWGRLFMARKMSLSHLSEILILRQHRLEWLSINISH